MDFDTKRVGQLLSSFDFPRLFVEELGWDRHNATLNVSASGETFSLKAVAQKRGAVAWICQPNKEGAIPTKAVRLLIDREVSKSAFEHIVVFVDAAKDAQVWVWPRRVPGRPIALVDHSWRAGGQNTNLIQRLRGLVFTLDEENDLQLPDVTTRLEASLNADRVTRRFYEQFAQEHKAFLSFIGGIESVADREWYASLMLNRLMFVYFMQRKGFLDGNIHYLREKLAACQKDKGQDKFYSFYRYFLLALFHKGLGSRERDKELEKLLGRIPYLNGGLFEKHVIEERSPDIRIPDNAFERVFAYFDRYQWHLDERPLRADNEINPDVLGYIFEKYINQKQMGAYYTKEDITGYITKNTVIPYLLDTSKIECRVAFENPGGPTVWDHLRDDPDRYIHEAVKKGVAKLLPEDITAGIEDVSKRTLWSAAATETHALPGEIWREVVARRERYESVRQKLTNGDVHEVNDLIILNLDIAQFAQDLVDRAEGPDLLRATWRAVERVTVLDPTCGSGAFLFAALNVLEPLYDACLNRMESFVADVDRADGAGSKRFDDFRTILERVATHPNRRYFILKSIILNNLFGVDIMEEAVEICKLRLFLKLAAQVDPDAAHPNLGIEPLPDIDFNVRAGNTLIGFASVQEVEEALSTTLDLGDTAEGIQARVADIARRQGYYREYQVQDETTSPGQDKRALVNEMKELADALSRRLAADVGVTSGDTAEFHKWCSSQRPFHWFLEFQNASARGGFDVIIGNPPYVEVPRDAPRSLLRRTFASALERWSRDEDLYTFVVERSLRLLTKDRGQFGMILPLSIAFSTKRPFVQLRQHLDHQGTLASWSHFDRIPSALFGNEVRTRCTILLVSRSSTAKAHTSTTSSFRRWNAEERESLFATLGYAPFELPLVSGVPKVGSSLQARTLLELRKRHAPLSTDLRDSISFSTLAHSAPNFPQPAVFVGGVAYNWFPAWREIPPTTDAYGKASLPARTAGYRFPDHQTADLVFALLCSSLGYWWWSVASDGFNLKKWLTDSFPLSSATFSEPYRSKLSALGHDLGGRLRSNYVYKDNRGRIGNYYLPACRDLTDQIDACLVDANVGISNDFIHDIREHNAMFSQSALSDDSIELPDDGE